jgi:hypothetical protein
LARLSHNGGIATINPVKRYAIFSRNPSPTRD